MSPEKFSLPPRRLIRLFGVHLCRSSQRRRGVPRRLEQSREDQMTALARAGDRGSRSGDLSLRSLSNRVPAAGKAQPLLALALLVALVPAVGASAASGPRNLIATPAVKAALRAAHLNASTPELRRKIHGPLKGSTYYGSYHSSKYAIATFSMDGLGTQDQPELFTKSEAGLWRDRGDTGGCISSRIIPPPMLELWGFKRDKLNPPCYLP